MEPQERHYKIEKLNRLFAIASLVLLLALLGLFIDDYFRTWKDYQRDFRTLEIEKTRVKYDAASHQLHDQEEYQTLLKELEAAKEKYASSCQSKDLEKEIATLKAKEDILTQEYKFAKAELDAAKYRYEEANAHQAKDLSITEKKFKDLDKKVSDFKSALEQSSTKVKEKTSLLNDCGKQYKELQRQERSLANQIRILELKLSKIDPDQMKFSNRIAQLVRDLPVIDLANPSNKIEQIVLKDLSDNVNFMRVPKVERCITCHLGIANPEYKNAPQPFTTHPNLELYLGNDSAHPLEEFGCTVCHGGRGRGTDFVSAVHTPSTPEQGEEWEKKYHWHKFHHWEDPMLPMPYVEAGCFKCHSSQTVIPQADKLNLGLQLIEKSGCYNCHMIEKYKDWPKSGPDLAKLHKKFSKDWTYRWIQDPQSFRHNTWMPSFFGQSNNEDPASSERAQQEIHAIVHFLFNNTEDFDLKQIPLPGDPKRGESIISSIGCLGCHQIQSEPHKIPLTRDYLRKEHGPNLIGLGSKTTQEWLFNWLKEPSRYHPGTRMPNLRLSDQEAADAASYLTTLKNAEFEKSPIPTVDEKTIDAIALSYLTRNDTLKTSEKRLAQMSLDEKLHLSGEKLVRHYGCFSCHHIKGMEKENPIGTELTEEGSKPVDKLDFGFIHIDHTNYAWLTQKLKDPRIFDHDKLKAPDEKLRMPNYHFTDEEIEAIVTAILGFVKEKPSTAKIYPPTVRNQSIQEGEKLVRQFNCQGCHILQGEGGTIRADMQEWFKKFDNRSESEADAIATSFSPPNLIGEGKKVHAEWLFHFLHQPTEIRPWLKVRMPTYNLNTAHLNALVKYFNALDDEKFPFPDIIDTNLTADELAAAQKLFSKDYFDCAICHIVGNQLPAGSPESWAPNFALSKERLKPQWIDQWLLNPQDLLPGTKMPTFFDPTGFENSGPEDILNGDENYQIRVLRSYLLMLSSETSIDNINNKGKEGSLEKESTSEETDSTQTIQPTEQSPQPSQSNPEIK